MPTLQLESQSTALPGRPVQHSTEGMEERRAESETALVGEVTATAEQNSIADNAINPSTAGIPVSISICVVLAAIWIGGILLIAGIVWGRLRERRNLLAGMTGPPSDELDGLLLRLERQLGIWRAVTILLTDAAIGPAVSGARRPEIYLPRKLADTLSPPQLEALVAHELVHVRRGDVWVARAQLLAQAVWWFHPAVWWMNRQIDRHRERCCDEEVLASLDGDRISYVSCLVDVLTARQQLKPLPWYPGTRRVEITTRRLEEIMKRSNMVHSRPPVWCWCVAVVVAVLALPGGRSNVVAQPSISATLVAESKDEKKSNDKSPVKRKKSAEKDKEILLKYGDGKADGKKSLGGSGEMIRFEMPEGVTKVTAIKIHGSRYGYPQAPKEDFEISFVNDDFSETLHTETAPYSTFSRAKSQTWVTVKFKEAVELPSSFWVVLNFNAEARKGVYVSYDTSTKGEHSRIGLPGDENPKPVDFGGDWMVQLQTAAK